MVLTNRNRRPGSALREEARSAVPDRQLPDPTSSLPNTRSESPGGDTSGDGAELPVLRGLFAELGTAGQTLHLDRTADYQRVGLCDEACGSPATGNEGHLAGGAQTVGYVDDHSRLAVGYGDLAS